MDMTKALAMSNNLYFAHLGEQLDLIASRSTENCLGWARRPGLISLAKKPGYLASEPPQTGVGMMTSFGDGIRLTPLELTSIVTTVANGGTMYYLQYPQKPTQMLTSLFLGSNARSRSAISFRQIKPGMMGAVEYGTARRANLRSDRADSTAKRAPAPIRRNPECTSAGSDPSTMRQE